jgi:RHS repeat-associated protein
MIAPGSGRTVSFKYDPFGRRIYKSSSSATSIYAYDGDNLIEETNSWGAAVARYAQTQNIDEPLAMLRSSTTSYYHADGLGSITSLSNSAGSLPQAYQYDSFGKQTASSGSLTNPFQYTARESDAETGLYYYRARYYDPTSGRFLSEDPISFRGGFNFYSYVLDDPLNWIDPFGLKTTVIIIYENGPGGVVFGGHAALYIDNGGDPILYDPAGGYGKDHLCGGGVCDEGKANVPRFKKEHEQSRDFHSMQIFVFDTTVDQETQIKDRILQLGETAGGFCALSVSTALDGIGPFKDLGRMLLPGSLGRALEAIQHQGRGGKK